MGGGEEGNGRLEGERRKGLNEGGGGGEDDEVKSHPNQHFLANERKFEEVLTFLLGVLFSSILFVRWGAEALSIWSSTFKSHFSIILTS